MGVYGRVVPGAQGLAGISVDLSKAARQRLKWFDHYQERGRNARLTCRYFGSPTAGEADGMSRRPSAVTRVALLGAAVAAGGLVIALLLASLPDRSRAEGVSQQAGTIIEATDLITDTVWSAAGSPYEVRGSVWIQPFVTLTIEKGVRLLLTADGGIDGQGNLVIRGTPGERVVVEGPPPQAGSPPLLGIGVAGSQRVEYADFRNISVAGCLDPRRFYIPCLGEPVASFEHVNLLESLVSVKGARVRLTDSKATGGYGIAVVSRPGEVIGNMIWLGQSVPQPLGAIGFLGALYVTEGTVISNTIIYNTNGGLYIGASTGVTITANNIYGNAGWDIAAFSGVGGPPRAPNNWWGTTDIATIQSHITGTLGFPPALDFLPIATAPIPGVPTPYAAYLPLVLNGATSW